MRHTLLSPPLAALLLLLLARWSGCAEECPGRPVCRVKGHSAVCSGGLHQLADHHSGARLRALTVCGWVGAALDPVPLARLPVRHLALLTANVSALARPFPAMPRLEVLNLTGLGLQELPVGFLDNLTSLRVLDLRNNRLHQLDAAVLDELDDIKHVYLAGNPWDCASPELAWLLGSEGRVVRDRDLMTCGDANFTDRPLMRVVAFTKAVAEQCPANCSCWVSYVAPTKDGFLLPIVTVDCSNRGLTELPDDIPENTTTLILRGNKISELGRLSAGAGHYGRVLDVVLDGNRVESLAELEGSRWLASFRALSVRNNLLHQLPTYAFADALDRNRNALSLLLGGNPWVCDCHFTPAFQDLLFKYSKLVRDLDDVRCQKIEGDENSNLMIKGLSRTSVCREHSSQLVQPLDLVNGFLAALIFLVLAKLAYDYWAFKRTGKLPWLVSKMP